LLHRALVQRALTTWLAFFSVLAMLGLLRSALHLVWFAAIFFFALLVARGARRRVCLAAAGPASLLLALYFKNLIEFGFFDSQSQSGGNAILITTYHLPSELRDEWVAEGKLSPFANLRFAAPPRSFLPYLGDPESERWSQHQLNELDRPSVGAPNYNHWFFLEVNRRRRDDALYYLKELPSEYLQTVWYGSLPQTFSASTYWHPRTGTPESPHYEHRQVLGWYEDAFNQIVHYTIFPPFGPYALLPLFLASVAWRGWFLLRSASDHVRATGAVWYFGLLQIGYLVPVIALLTWGENARYRYIIEPFIWLIVTATLADFVRASRTSLVLSPKFPYLRFETLRQDSKVEAVQRRPAQV